MTDQTIFDELFVAAQTTGMKTQGLQDPDEEFLTSLVRCVGVVSDQVWQGLSVNSQRWYNEACAAVNSLKPVPPCPGFKGNPAPAGFKGAQTPDGPVNTPLPPKRGKKAGVVDEIRKVVVLHPDWNNRQIHEYLQTNGFPDAKLETVSVNTGDIRSTIAVVKQLGFWKE